MRKRYYLLPGLLLFLTVFLLLFYRDTPPLVEKDLPQEEFHQEFTNITLYLHTHDEEMTLELQADRYVEYSSHKESFIYHLKALLYEEEDILFSFQGDEGSISPLRDSVKVENPIIRRGNEVSLTCGHLLFGLKEGIVRGEGGVLYQDEAISIRAESFTYNPREGKIYLKENAKLLFKEGGRI